MQSEGLTSLRGSAGEQFGTGAKDGFADGQPLDEIVRRTRNQRGAMER
jgi:hypothetical protein